MQKKYFGKCSEHNEMNSGQVSCLVYYRNKCDADFAVVTDDSGLCEFYGKMYDTKCSVLNYTDILNQENFFLLHKRLENDTGKKICTVKYIAGEKKMEYYLPGSKNSGDICTEAKRDFDALQVIENLMYLTLEPKEGFITLHGGAVAENGKAIILSASTTSGKSTLVSFLRLRGYECITDDEIFISQQTMQIEPVYKEMSLRQGGYDILLRAFNNDEPARKLLTDAARITRGGADYYLLSPDHDLKFGRYDISAVVFLKGYGSCDPYIKKMNIKDAFMQLLKSQLSSQNLDKNINEKYKIFAELAKKTYEMKYSDLETAEKYLQCIIRE